MLSCGVSAMALVIFSYGAAGEARAGSPAQAAQPARAFNIPAGDLDQALGAYARQSGQEILYTSDLVAGRRTAGVSGSYEPRAALRVMLRGTGLVIATDTGTVITLRRMPASHADASGAEPDVASTELEDVVVTGTLLRSPGAVTSPVIVIGRDDIDRRGLATVAETLLTLPQNYSGSGTPTAVLGSADPSGGNSALSTSVNLRGLGASATLSLINGRRLAGSGSRGELSDLSALPSGAVERVDVLLDGASALYGADAVAGVVNVIMRRSFDGQESRLRASAAQGGAEDVSASHLFGRTWSTGSALLAYEYQTTNALNAADRAYTRDGDLRPFGGSDQRRNFASPGNIVVFDAVTRGYISQFAIRPGASGAATTRADFVAGQTNLTGAAVGNDLIPAVERHSAYGRLKQSLGDRLELSGDLRFSDRRYDVANPATASIVTVTSANPHFVSPTGATSHTLAYSFLNDLGNPRRNGASRSLGVTAGAAIDLGRGWSLDGYLALAEEKGERLTTGSLHSLFLAEALGNRADDAATPYSARRDGYFNPFGAGTANSRTVLDFIGSGYSNFVDRSRSGSANILIEGPLFALPGGDVQVALGAQLRRESFSTRYENFTSTILPVSVITPKREREIAAAFGEARIPIFGPDNAAPGLRSLELSVAGRVEEYDDFGTTTNPKVGIAWSPVANLNVRASYGTSFRAPGLPQLFDASAVTVTFVPRTDGARVLSIYQYGGNPDLAPETATTWTFGADYATERGSRFSLGYFSTRFTDRIAQPANENLNSVLIDPGLAPFVQLVDPASNATDRALVESYTNAPGATFGGLYPVSSYGAIIDARWVNASSAEVSGIDASAVHSMQIGDTSVTLDASASYLLDYKIQISSASPMQSVVGRAGYPARLRGRMGVTWNWTSLSGALHLNHVSDYADITGRRIDAWNTIDTQVAWAPESRWMQGATIALTAQNLLDEDPPFYNASIGLGYDPGQTTPLGRVIALQLIKRW